MKNLVHWIPAAFCAFTLAVAAYVEAKSGVDSLVLKSSFVWFPMCFVFVGIATAQMQKEMEELRRRLATLEEEKAGAGISR